MTKPALAAVVALALSLPLASLSAGAQESSAETKAQSSSTTKAQSSSTVQTTFSAPQQANKSHATQVGTAPTGWKTYNTRQTQTTSTAVTTPATPAAPATKPDDMVTVTQGKTRISEGNGNRPIWQKFYEYVQLKQGQDNIPLTLVVTNGDVPAHPAFTAVRVFLSGQQLASEKDFKNNVLQLKMDKTLTAGGDNQMTIQAYGVPNAAISWKLMTPRAILTAVTPTTAGVGDSVTITGRNFSNVVGANKIPVTQVWIGDKIATVTSGNAKKLVVTIPPSAVDGENKLNVAVAGIAAKPLKITIKANKAPELTSTDLYGCPPGTQVTLTGKGFSDKPAENVVTVGGIQATVVSSTQTSIVFLMPDAPNLYAAQPLQVKTKNVVSSNTLNVTASNRLLPTSLGNSN